MPGLYEFNEDPEISVRSYSALVSSKHRNPDTHMDILAYSVMGMAKLLDLEPQAGINSYTVLASIRADHKPFGGFYTAEETPGSEEPSVIYSDLFFPKCITYGSSGVPKYVTEKTEVDSGAEQRNQRRAYPRHSYNILMENMNSEDISEIMNLWHVCAGDFIGFMFLDPMDHTSANNEACLTGEEINATDQLVASALGVKAEYPLFKYYESGIRQRKRRIRYPDLDTLVVAVNGYEIPDFEYDTSDCVLRFVKPIPTMTADLERDSSGLITGADFSALSVGSLVYMTGWGTSAYNAPEGGNPARVTYADGNSLRVERFNGTNYGSATLSTTTVTIKSALPPTGSEITAGFYFYVPVRFDDGDNMSSELQSGMRDSAVATFDNITLREIFE